MKRKRAQRKCKKHTLKDLITPRTFICFTNH